MAVLARAPWSAISRSTLAPSSFSLFFSPRAFLSSTLMSSTAIPLATSPALYPPIPSASTASPNVASAAMLSSLCDRTIPGWVAVATSSTALRSVIIPSRSRRRRRPRSRPLPRRRQLPQALTQRLRHLLAVLVTLVRFLGKSLVHDDPEQLRQRGIVRANVRGLLVGNLVHELRHRLAGERQLSARELVERHTQREQVGAALDLLAGELFRRHVGRRAQHHAGLGLG